MFYKMNEMGLKYIFHLLNLEIRKEIAHNLLSPWHFLKCKKQCKNIWQVMAEHTLSKEVSARSCYFCQNEIVPHFRLCVLHYSTPRKGAGLVSQCYSAP